MEKLTKDLKRFELDSIISVEIKTLITELELYDEQILSLEKRIDQMMKLIDSRIMSIPGIGDTLGPMILGEIGVADRFSSAKKLIAFAGLDPVVIRLGRFENVRTDLKKRFSTA